MTKTMARHYALKALQSREGRSTDHIENHYQVHAYRRPGKVQVFVYSAKERGFLNTEDEFVFEGDDFEELKALAMQKALEKV